MGGFQRSIGARAIRHADPDSKIHAEDVERNNERRSLYWLGVEQRLEDNHRVLPELGSGLLFVRDRATGDLLAVDGDEHTLRMDEWNADLNYYLREVADKKCTSGKRWMKTRCKGVSGHVITASPWWSNVLYEAAQAGEADKVLELGERAAVELAHTFQAQTKRRVLSVQCHYDTTSMHWHIFASRIGDDHKLIPGTTKAVGLVGPWCVGVLRQGEVGAIPEDSTNLKVARRLHQRNERRMGSAPIDHVMAKAVDNLCYAMFGVSPRLPFWLGVYRSGVVGMCIDRLVAIGDASYREADNWRTHGKDYAQPAVGFGGGVNGGGREVLLK